MWNMNQRRKWGFHLRPSCCRGSFLFDSPSKRSNRLHFKNRICCLSLCHLGNKNVIIRYNHGMGQTVICLFITTMTLKKKKFKYTNLKLYHFFAKASCETWHSIPTPPKCCPVVNNLLLGETYIVTCKREQIRTSPGPVGTLLQKAPSSRRGSTSCVDQQAQVNGKG